MNKEDLARRRNDTARLFRQTSKIHRGCIRLNAGSTWEHELAKIYKCRELLRQGKDFITEAEFEGGQGRADIVCLDEGVVYEIVQTESEESIQDKRKRYPLPIVVIKC